MVVPISIVSFFKNLFFLEREREHLLAVKFCSILSCMRLISNFIDKKISFTPKLLALLGCTSSLLTHVTHVFHMIRHMIDYKVKAFIYAK
jgi:hypothetical protein